MCGYIWIGTVILTAWGLIGTVVGILVGKFIKAGSR